MSVRILVVDDETDVVDMFRQRFRREIRSGRFVLDFAHSGADALQVMAQAEGQQLILLLSDINMPGMNGLELLQRVKSERPDLPVLMITAYEDDATRAAALRHGADGILSKPLDFGLLRTEIDARIGA